ncbi:MAG: ChbG/HpnK family deacetylase [Paludibacter sp.]|nr:ChbG/HpnK family deacetylase [Paludibacter sp.]
MSNLIINADDFGISKAVNYAIMAAMDSTICTDTTFLANFEESENAANLAISINRTDRVGIHLNLTEGLPLSLKIRNEPRFCNQEGYFHNRKLKHIVQLSKSERIAVQEELTSQIRLSRKFGMQISHADSHNHIHEEPGLGLLIMDILKNENIPYLRLTNNIGKTSFVNKMYRSTYNLILGFKGLTVTEYFGSISDLNNYKKVIADDSVVELMIHPGNIVDNQILDVYSKENLSLLLPQIIERNRLISYSQL